MPPLNAYSRMYWRDFWLWLIVFSAEKPPKIDEDQVPREITVRAGQPFEIDVPYKGIQL